MSGNISLSQNETVCNGQPTPIPAHGIKIKNGHITLTINPTQAGLLVQACDQIQFSDPTHQILIDSLAAILKAGLTAAVCQCWLGADSAKESATELAVHLGGEQ